MGHYNEVMTLLSPPCGAAGNLLLLLLLLGNQTKLALLADVALRFGGKFFAHRSWQTCFKGMALH